jgi:hypothetical protein
VIFRCGNLGNVEIPTEGFSENRVSGLIETLSSLKASW